MRQSWEFLKRVEAGGVKIRSEDQASNDELLLEKFSYSLAGIAERTYSASDPSTFGAHFDGILILIDEADNASTNLSLGSFFKLLTERLQRRGCNCVSFGIAGLPELRTVLSSSHGSSLRLFEELVLSRLSSGEVNRVIDAGLRRANTTNTEQTTITDEARHSLAYFSEGYPHFIQQFAYSAFAVDEDNVIDANDVAKGAFGKRGALDLIGDRYYRDSLDNALVALRERQLILGKEGQRGAYRLQHKGFAWWIKLYTTDAANLQQQPLEIPTQGE